MTPESLAALLVSGSGGSSSSSGGGGGGEDSGMEWAIHSPPTGKTRSFFPHHFRHF
jgi:hypothetical protein